MAYQNNRPAWEKHYQREKSRQRMPDENVVRYIHRYYNEIERPHEVTILDLGAGSGRNLSYVRTLFDRVIGMDYSLNALRGQADTVCASGDALPFASQSFDLILCWGVLHYLPAEARQKAVSEIRRTLRPGGRFFGTLRSDQDTHLKKVMAGGDLEGGAAELFSQEEAAAYFREFSSIKFGFIARRPLGEEELIAHHIVEASL